jgi:phosphatidylglycerol:prolipoprotein diacylglycerol transferase
MFPIHLNLGFRVFYFYEGFYFLVAIATACLFAGWRLNKAKLDVQGFIDSVPWILLGSILGARIFHFVFWDWNAFRADPMTFFRLWEGGLAIAGGLVGGVSAAWICFRRGKLDFWAYSWALSPAVLIGQAIGRLGCFLNGDAWGTPTRLPWGVAEPKFGRFFPGFTLDRTIPSSAWEWSVAKGYTAQSALKTIPLHPTQMYEALCDLLLAGLVLLSVRSLARKPGPPQKPILLHLGGYSLVRFGLEFLHGDRGPNIWSGMTTFQIGLLACGTVCGSLYLMSERFSVRKAPASLVSFRP